jgi:hypothetical protein
MKTACWPKMGGYFDRSTSTPSGINKRSFTSGSSPVGHQYEYERPEKERVFAEAIRLTEVLHTNFWPARVESHTMSDLP